MKETIKETIVSNQRSLPNNETRERFWKIPFKTDKVITLPGVRRCGKSSHFLIAQNTLLQGGVPREHMLFLNLDDERLDFSESTIGFIIDAYRELYPHIALKDVHIFLDEIQIADGWEQFVRRVYDTISKNVYITGSNSKMLSSEIASALRGRTLQFEVFPLSFSEYCDFKNIEKNMYDSTQRAFLIHAFNEYLYRGGFPEIALGNETFIEQILQEYYYVMIFKDLVERYGVKNPQILRYLVKRLIANITKPTSIHNIYHEIKSAGMSVSKTSMYEFVQQLESIYLFLSLPKFSASPVKEFSGMPKYYCIDNGFNYALQGRASENRGAFLENAVYLHLRRKHPFGQGLFYLKEKHECDFVRFEKLEVIELVQVCWSLENPETARREINGLMEAAHITGCKNLSIVTFDSEKVIDEGEFRISVIPAWKYMLRE